MRALLNGTSLVVLTAMAMLLSACGTPPAPEVAPLAGLTPPAITVYITDESCPNVEVETGFSIGWRNDGKKKHILQSEPQPDGQRLFDSGTLQPGDGFAMTFDKPGTITYRCSEDGSLKGMITVRESGAQSKPLQPVLGSGVSHSCLLTQQGGVLCWGMGPMQVPVAPPGESDKPMLVEGLDAVALATGWYHTCAVVRDGRVQCWGQNASGQLGDGTQQDSISPVKVADLDDVTSLTAGAAHTCALTESGAVYCWGQNTSGQLGDGSLVDRSRPVPVTGLTGPAAAIEAGSLFTCALLASGPVECWGDFSFVPVEESGRIHTSAMDIPNLDQDVRQIAAGNYHLCVLTTSSEVKCEGMMVAPNDPPFVTLSTNLGEHQGHVQQIHAGTDFNCVLTDSGEVLCWGDNYFDQLGNGTFITSEEPIKVNTGGREIIALGGGAYTACMLAADGTTRCWGDTSFGQIGDGSARWK